MTPPPIASPHGDQQVHRSQPPPFRGLRIFILLNVLVLSRSLINLLYLPHAQTSWSVVGVFFAFFLPLWGLLLWRLWNLSGTARAIFWWISALSFAGALVGEGSLQDMHNMPPWVQGVNYAAEALNIFGLVWLQLPGVKAHFQKSS